MAGTSEAIQETLSEVKSLTPTERNKLAGSLLTTITDIKKPVALRAAAMRAEMAQYMPVPLTLVSALGGLLAEPVRRSVVGRLVTPVVQQGLGLIGLGFGLQWLGKIKGYEIPLVGPVGAAHVAYGGALISVGFYGSKKNPDPVKLALEGTTYKALNPDKKADDEGDT